MSFPNSVSCSYACEKAHRKSEVMALNGGDWSLKPYRW